MAIATLPLAAAALSFCAILGLAAQVPVSVPGDEVFLERFIIVDRGAQLAATSQVLPFSSMQRCLDWRAKNSALDFGIDRPTHEGNVYTVSVTSECAPR